MVEHAFRVLKSELLLRPVWHHYSGRTQAHVMICVLAYALWKTLDHLAKRAGLETEIHKPDPHRARAAPKPRPMTPEVILRELGQIAIVTSCWRRPTVSNWPCAGRSTDGRTETNPGSPGTEDT